MKSILTPTGGPPPTPTPLDTATYSSSGYACGEPSFFGWCWHAV